MLVNVDFAPARARRATMSEACGEPAWQAPGVALKNTSTAWDAVVVSQDAKVSFSHQFCPYFYCYIITILHLVNLYYCQYCGMILSVCQHWEPTSGYVIQYIGSMISCSTCRRKSK